MNTNLAENLPERFTRNIKGLFGAKGEKWLIDLPGIIAEISQKWALTIEQVFANLSFNYVVLCAGETGEKYVLKIGVPEKDSPILDEKRALEAFDGKGAVRLLKFDEQTCAMLLERAVPGTTLGEIFDEDYARAVEIAIGVIKELPRHPPNKAEFVNLETWISGLNRAVKANFEAAMVSKAQQFFAELTQPFERKVLLHGDIHFDNILSARREPFLAIDPKGIVGELGYEIAVFLNDLAGWTEHLANQQEVLESAVESFAMAFAISPRDLRKWAYAFAVLSAWWTMEDFGENKQENILRADIWDV